MIGVGDIIYRISKDINKVRKYSGIQFMRGLVTEESEDSDGNKVYSILFDGHKSSTEYYDREIQEMHTRKELYYSYEELMDVVRNDIPDMVEKYYGKKQEIPLAKGDVAYKVYTHFGRKNVPLSTSRSAKLLKYMKRTERSCLLWLLWMGCIIQDVIVNGISVSCINRRISSIPLTSSWNTLKRFRR